MATGREQGLQQSQEGGRVPGRAAEGERESWPQHSSRVCGTLRGGRQRVRSRRGRGLRCDKEGDF
jgi:hypothetical protein